MNITPQVPNLSIPTVLNPHTESLRRENNQREVITQPAATSQSSAEKGVASDKERGRTPAQNNADIDFASITEQAELANSSITGQNDQGHTEQEQANEQTTESQDASKSDVGDSVDGNEDQTPEQVLEQERVISELKARDQEVRTHEAAHAAVGGSIAGSPSYSYEQGPDGKKYAVSGEVSVDVAPVSGDPRATITKMQKVYSAALAPASPSAQDRSVASAATQQILTAQSELLVKLANEEDAAKTTSNTKESDNTAVIETSSSNSQSDVITQRSLRIESFYSNITKAYEKAPTYNFELTA
ncbi:putative metalloprotease CJM1_0395 family protein [Colwellia sp. 20A7]|uniref:putative metalloprotease CJM1_0395 family protein n=1 Tax=Colwellia sp. 20A7 TaxID=2689569 RepID=UPI00135B9E6D|nr:putative metalloprotease CJM1_0395 family protein [Colwellia sp. 20A7]